MRIKSAKKEIRWKIGTVGSQVLQMGITRELVRPRIFIRLIELLISQTAIYLVAILRPPKLVAESLMLLF